MSEAFKDEQDKSGLNNSEKKEEFAKMLGGDPQVMFVMSGSAVMEVIYNNDVDGKRESKRSVIARRRGQQNTSGINMDNLIVETINYESKDLNKYPIVTEEDLGQNKDVKWVIRNNSAELVETDNNGKITDRVVRSIKGNQVRFSSTAYSPQEANITGILGGGLPRVIAAYEMARVMPDMKVITMSNSVPFEKNDAQIMMSELENLESREKKLLGNYYTGKSLKDRLEILPNPISMLTEIIEVLKYTERHKLSQVAIMTNDVYKGRAEAFLGNIERCVSNYKLNNEEVNRALEYFKNKKNDGLVKVIAAEDVLPYRHRLYKKLIDYVHNSNLYAKTKVSEAQGIDDIKNGVYGMKR